MNLQISERLRLLHGMTTALPAAAIGRATADSMLDHCARRHPDGTAIAFLDERITYRQVRERADQYARFFASQGIGVGDRVVLNFDNRPNLLLAFHGLQRIGAVAALINTNLSGAPLAHVVKIVDPALIVFGSEHADKLAALQQALPDLDPSQIFVDAESSRDSAPDGLQTLNEAVAAQPTDPLDPLSVKANDHCVYIYTSGTTGLPKAAVIPHVRFAVSGAMAGHTLHRAKPGELIYVTLPLYHSNGLMLGWSAALATGAGIALRRKFSASAFFADARTFGAISAVYIGELCRYLLQTPEQPHERDHQLRSMAGNGMRPDIWEEFQERFAVPTIREFYGATEGMGFLVNLAGKPGMVGRLPPGNVIVRCDPTTGEVVRSPRGFCRKVRTGETGLLLSIITKAIPFEGYLDREASEAKVLTDVFWRGDRYFNSGDLLRLHEGRWVSFVDRLGDTFRWKAENVSTNEVADVLNEAIGVAESNVYGVKITGSDGRAGMAELVVEPDFDRDVLARFVRDQLPAYERPLFLRITSDPIDVTGTFKHQKVHAREQGFDPDVVDDPLFYLADDRYLPIDAKVFAAIETGQIVPG